MTSLVIIRDQTGTHRERGGGALFGVDASSFDRRSHDPFGTPISFQNSRKRSCRILCRRLACLSSLASGQLGVGLRGRRPFILRAGAFIRRRPLQAFCPPDRVCQDLIDPAKSHRHAPSSASRHPMKVARDIEHGLPKNRASGTSNER